MKAVKLPAVLMHVQSWLKETFHEKKTCETQKSLSLTLVDEEHGN